jgi:hypothetical protein
LPWRPLTSLFVVLFANSVVMTESKADMCFVETERGELDSPANWAVANSADEGALRDACLDKDGPEATRCRPSPPSGRERAHGGSLRTLPPHPLLLLLSPLATNSFRSRFCRSWFAISTFPRSKSATTSASWFVPPSPKAVDGGGNLWNASNRPLVQASGLVPLGGPSRATGRGGGVG